MLHLDQYGALLPNGMCGKPAGVAGIVGPNWSGTLPTGIIRVDVPYKFTKLLFRADKYSPKGINMTKEAEKFCRNVLAQGLSEYQKNLRKALPTLSQKEISVSLSRRSLTH